MNDEMNSEMDDAVAEAKRAMRERYRAVRQALSKAERAVAEAGAAEQLGRWLDASGLTVGSAFVSWADAEELGTRGMIEALRTRGWQVGLPRVKGEAMEVVMFRGEQDLVAGRFGLLEPRGHVLMDPSTIGLVILPAVAADLAGRRLGRGGGYYDRWLAGFSGEMVVVVFDEQVVERVPVAEHDVGVDWVLTPTRVVRCEG